MLPVMVLGRKSIVKRVVVLGSAYFALIGLSFMMLEINMINRFTIFIGVTRRELNSGSASHRFSLHQALEAMCQALEHGHLRIK